MNVVIVGKLAGKETGGGISQMTCIMTANDMRHLGITGVGLKYNSSTKKERVALLQPAYLLFSDLKLQSRFRTWIARKALSLLIWATGCKHEMTE